MKARVLASLLLKAVGAASLVSAAVLFLLLVGAEAKAQGPSACPLVDGKYICNKDCHDRVVGPSDICNYSCNDRPGTSCDACGCGRVINQNKCTCKNNP
jgi:hypothetical protein